MKIPNRLSFRITPAYAGKSFRDLGLYDFSEDHPRLRGEKSCFLIVRNIVLGSPPLTRGKALTLRLNLYIVGITPAYAGKRRPRLPNRFDERDHPRLRGEKAFQA